MSFDFKRLLPSGQMILFIYVRPNIIHFLCFVCVFVQLFYFYVGICVALQPFCSFAILRLHSLSPVKYL